MTSTFNWNNGQPSIFYTPEGHRAAQRLEKSQGGKSLDIKGRAVIDMRPHAAQSIAITSQSAADKTARIKYGALI